MHRNWVEELVDLPKAKQTRLTRLRGRQAARPVSPSPVLAETRKRQRPKGPAPRRPAWGSCQEERWKGLGRAQAAQTKEDGKCSYGYRPKIRG